MSIKQQLIKTGFLLSIYKRWISIWRDFFYNN